MNPEASSPAPSRADGKDSPAPPSAESTPVASPRPSLTPDGHGPGHHHHGSVGTLALAALGVVYGDIGTSPLYALKECVHGPHAVAPTPDNVLGLLSLMFWSITLVVSFKYLGFVTRASNQGEGGGLAMLALLDPVLPKPKHVATVGVIASLITFGACLLYGEGILTPAISVLSAVEGLGVATHKFDPAIVPITVAILIGLFAVQKRGTATIGRVFGPVMVVWFTTLAGLGLYHIAQYPGILRALNPSLAIEFFGHNGTHGFVVLGSVVLCITGGEALYADMGHFGRKPIQLAWFGLAMPALVLNYFGQGAMLLSHPGDIERLAANPFYSLVPDGPPVFALVAIATAATVIASQALISGAYSLTRQAVQLGYLPRVRIQHTSSEAEGQIYIPEVNTALAIGCITLVLTFKSSSSLAAAYGISVMGTMAITSIAFLIVCTKRWNWPLSQAIPLFLVFITVDLAFFSSNLLKFFDGGYVPVVIAISLFVVMRVWKRGRALLGQYFVRASKPLDAFLAGLAEGRYQPAPTADEPEPASIPIVRVPGTAVFLTSNPNGTPPLLLHHARHNKAIHEAVLLVTVVNEPVPRVTSSRVAVEPIEQGFFRIKLRVGFMETPNVPRMLAVAIRAFRLPFSVDDITYYLGRETVLAATEGEMGLQEERLFAFLTRNAQQATRFFGIPPERVVEIGMQVDL
jgi:KUP system potassium uptake protein